MKLRFALFALVFLSTVFSVYSQPQTSETAVQVLRSIGKKNDFYCTTESALMTKESFEKFISARQCTELKTMLNVDFEKESLIGFRARSDCHMQAAAKIFRNDAAKKYVVRVEIKYGGCRAAGNHQGWLVVEKLKPDFAVEFTETESDKIYLEWNSNDVTHFIKDSFETLQTKQFEMKGCIQTHSSKEFAIKTQDEYLKAIRPDASRDWCLKNLETIDFEKYSLLGMGITSDYCGVPAGLEYKVLKDSENEQYLFNVSYLKTEQLCRRIGRYDLWLLVPKIEENYSVKFDLKERLN